MQVRRRTFEYKSEILKQRMSEVFFSDYAVNSEMYADFAPSLLSRRTLRQVGKEDMKLTNAFCMIRYQNFPLRHFFPELHFVIQAFIILCIKV